MHILHNYALLCIILNFRPLSEPVPIISQESFKDHKFILEKIHNLHKYQKMLRSPKSLGEKSKMLKIIWNAQKNVF